MRRAFDATVRFYWGEGIADDCPALTYFLVLSLAPFTLGLAALATLIFGDELQPAAVAAEVAKFMPREVRDDVTGLVLATKRDSTVLLVGAIAAAMWTTSGAIGVIERVISRICAARRYPMVLGRLRNIALGAAVALLLLASVVVASLVGGLAGLLELKASTSTRLLSAGNLVGAVAFCACIYRYSSRVRLRWRYAFMGAVPAAVIIQVAPVLVGLYFSGVAGAASATVFLSFAVVLLGCFTLAQGLLVGAGLAAVMHRRSAAQQD